MKRGHGQAESERQSIPVLGYGQLVDTHPRLPVLGSMAIIMALCFVVALKPVYESAMREYRSAMALLSMGVSTRMEEGPVPLPVALNAFLGVLVMWVLLAGMMFLLGTLLICGSSRMRGLSQLIVRMQWFTSIAGLVCGYLLALGVGRIFQSQSYISPLVDGWSRGAGIFTVLCATGAFFATMVWHRVRRAPRDIRLLEPPE